MKILFLDDMKERHKHAAEWFGPGSEIVPAQTAAEALGLYLLTQSSSRPFALVSLDRDLGAGQWTGEDVVDHVLHLHLVMGAGLVRPALAIHSWNIPAAERMHNRLQWAGFSVARLPFSPPTYQRALDDEMARRSTRVDP